MYIPWGGQKVLSKPSDDSLSVGLKQKKGFIQTGLGFLIHRLATLSHFDLVFVQFRYFLTHFSL
jgi:hypothetical protein